MARNVRVPAAWWVGEAINDDRSVLLCITAGLGSGKTHGLCQWHHYRKQQNPTVPFSGFMEPNYNLIMKAAIPTYRKVLESYGMKEGYDFEVVKSPFPLIRYLDAPPYHEVHFVSAHNPGHIVAVEYGWATEDEAALNDVDASRNFRSRIRDGRSRHLQLFKGGAPDGINHLAEQFDSDTLPGWITSDERDHIQPSRKYRRFKVWTDDNPFLPEGYLDQLQDIYGHNPNLIRAKRYGEFCELSEGNAYRNYSPQKHDIDDVEPEPYQPIHLTWDFNSAPLAWIAVQKMRFDEYGERKTRNVAVHEANLGSTQLDEACVEFAAKFPRENFANTLIELYGDMSGHASSHKMKGSDYDAIRNYLNRLGYSRVEIRASRSNPPEGSSVDALDRCFLQDVIRISKRCRMLKRSLLATRWKKGVRKLDKPSGETHTHHSDALKYWAHATNAAGADEKQIYGKNW